MAVCWGGSGMFSFLAFCRRTAQESDVGMESDYVRLGGSVKENDIFLFCKPLLCFTRYFFYFGSRVVF